MSNKYTSFNEIKFQNFKYNKEFESNKQNKLLVPLKRGYSKETLFLPF